MVMAGDWDHSRAVDLVNKCVSREMRPGIPLPGDSVDLVNTGLIDSMGWVGILTAIEDETGIQTFGNLWPEGRSQSIGSLVAEIVRFKIARKCEFVGARTPEPANSNIGISLVGWGHAVGSLRIGATAIQAECNLAAGTISERAGIESVARVDGNESELTLAQHATEIALQTANLDPEKEDLLVVTSATHLGFPSLAATLHIRLLLREPCCALDVGGACVGVIYALATAKALLLATRQNVALVVASEVNSRRFLSPSVPGEFRGLFGDGACAFVLARSDSVKGDENLRLGDFIWGCDGTSSAALRLSLHETGTVEVQFKGEQLAKAAALHLGRILEGLETLAGSPRTSVDYFAIHEPNPRLVQVISQNSQIPMDKIAQVCKSFGNLGSATCGVGLSKALSKTRASRTAEHRPLIFVAAVGPGLLWGGTYLH
jgi:3-oxoacyl-[acyl-carrier-protein] synthase-3